MNNLTPIVYQHAPDRRGIKNLYHSAFPKYEQMPWWLLRLLATQEGVTLTGYYDGDAFCGLTYSAQTEDVLFLLFFAAETERRGQGYGSAILELLKQQHPGKTIYLNIELLDETAENYAERLRRFHFYQRNGFFDTGLDIDEVGGTFRVLASRQEIDVKAYQQVFLKMSLGLWKPYIREANT